MIRRVALGCGTFELGDDGPSPAPFPSAPAREPAVLLHGFTGNKQNWAPLRDEVARTRRVLSLDLPGHGGTEMAHAEGCSMERTAAAVIELLVGALAVHRFVLVGYSMGGRLALFIALHYPDRVERLVLESASAGIADRGERQARIRSDEALARLVETDGIEAFVDRWELLPLFSSLAGLPAEARDELRRQRLACSPAGLAASLRAIGTATQPYLGRRLGELRMPVLVVAGALDAKFVEIGKNLSAGIACSRLAIVEGAGHIPHVERAAEFNRLVMSFLDNDARQTSP
jgi:2-succinyl-6-hydroxy-2,4-cyclohexadiene-1-carboxylate synthase